MDIHSTIESIPFIWGIAFSVNILMSVCLFTMIIRRAMPGWSAGPLMWIAWWTMANALSLVINDVLGTNSPFSYHQMGILTESMVNLGVCVWSVNYLMMNWNLVGDKKWKLMDEYRKKLSGDCNDS
jgi:hypothetical protein